MRLSIRALFLSLGLLLIVSCFKFVGRNYLDNGDIEVFCGMDYAAKYNWEKELVLVIGSNAYKDPIKRYATAEELGISVVNDDLDLSSLFQAKHPVDAGAKRIELFYTGYSGDDDADVPKDGEMEVWVDADVLSQPLEPDEDGTAPEKLYMGSFYFKRSAQAIFDEEALSQVLSFDCAKTLKLDEAKEISLTLKGAKFKACPAREIDWFSPLPDGIKAYIVATEENSSQSAVKFFTEAPPKPTQNSVRPSFVIPPDWTTIEEGVKAGENLSIFVAKKLSERAVRISDCATLATPGWDVEKRDIVIRIDGDCISRDISALDYAGEPMDFTSIIKDSGTKGSLPNGVKLYLQEDIKAGDTEFKVYLKGTIAQENEEGADSADSSTDTGASSTVIKNYIDNTLYQFNLKLNGTDFDDSEEGLKLLSRPDNIETNTSIGYGQESTRNENAYLYVCRIADLSYKMLNPKPLNKFTTEVAIAIDNKPEQKVGGLLFSNNLNDYTHRIKKGSNVTSWIKNDLSSVIKDFKAVVEKVELIQPDPQGYSFPVITLTLSGEVLDIQQDFEESLAVSIPASSLPWTSKAIDSNVPFRDIQVVRSKNCKFKITAD